MEKTMDKAIITVVGKDTVGIIAKVCTYLADNGVNVLDISQTIVSGFFNMILPFILAVSLTNTLPGLFNVRLLNAIVQLS